MDIIKHEDNGAKALRFAVSVFVVIGWCLFILGVIGAFLADDVIFILPLASGVISLGICYLIACVVRGFATIVEAAQLYKDLNTPIDTEEE